METVTEHDDRVGGQKGASAAEVELHLPLPNLAFHILLAIAEGDLHGYAVAKDIERRTAGLTKPSTGSMYLAILKLQDKGFLERSPGRPPAERDDARRRYYRLTDLGRRVARAESERLAAMVEVAVARRLIRADELAGAAEG